MPMTVKIALWSGAQCVSTVQCYTHSHLEVNREVIPIVQLTSRICTMRDNTYTYGAFLFSQSANLQLFWWRVIVGEQ